LLPRARTDCPLCARYASASAAQNAAEQSAANAVTTPLTALGEIPQGCSPKFPTLVVGEG